MATSRRTLQVGFCGWIAAQSLAAAGAAWLQPASGSTGLTFELAGRSARVSSEGGRVRTLRLRTGERLTAAAELPDGWVAAGIRTGDQIQELVVLTGGSGPGRRLAPPPGANLTWRARPVVLAGSRGLEGLAWLEGSPHGALTVHAVRWTGDGWEAPTTVAWPHGGSQSGLAGAVLSDGTWLLVWARFDGEDDELVWSARRGDTWSAPEAVTAANTVPDVTPTLFPLSDGALLAWSRLVDGEYRVLCAQLSGTTWSTPQPVTSRGGVYPGFAGRDGTPFLVVRSTSPVGWVVLELDPSGRPLRQAAAASTHPGRPALRLGDGVARLQLPLAGEEAILSWETVP